jgi:hypothetical protein
MVEVYLHTPIRLNGIMLTYDQDDYISILLTKQTGGVFMRRWIRILAGTSAILTVGFHGFPQSLQVSSEIVPRLPHDFLFPNPTISRYIVRY